MDRPTTAPSRSTPTPGTPTHGTPTPGTPTHGAPSAGISRRTALAGVTALAGILASCARGGVRAPLPPPTAQESLDDRLRLAAVDDERRLLALYAATAARHPSLASLLAVPRAHHAEHARRLGAPQPTAAAVPAVPADPKAAVAALTTAEQAAAGSRRTGCARASSVLRPLLASIGAAEAVHAALLDAAPA